MEVREIVATGGQVILVDADDYRWLKWFRWGVSTGYAVSGYRAMHRIVMDAPDGMLVDHKNRNRFDNRKCNLRLATAAQNNRNMPLVPSSNKKVPFRGVVHCGRKNKHKTPKRPWRAVIRTDGGKINLGYFATQIEAANAYDSAAIKYHGEFATLNFQNPINGDSAE